LLHLRAACHKGFGLHVTEAMGTSEGPPIALPLCNLLFPNFREEDDVIRCLRNLLHTAAVSVQKP
jgi:hypothetical protein